MYIQLVMTIAGTIIVIGYMLLKFLYQNRIESKWKIYFLRMAVIIYLFPFQLSKYRILPQKILDKTRVREWITQNLQRRYNMPLINFKIGDNTYYSMPVIVFFITVFLLIIAAVFFLKNYGQYFKMRENLKKASIEVKELEAERIFAKEVKIFQNADTYIPCTLGWLRPIILIPQKQYTEEERHWLLCHEITHIKHNDIFWKHLLVLVCALHWYNPFAYYILWEYTNVCEQYCDEECMQYASKEERKQYAIFLVKSALVDKQQKICLFSSGLTNGGEKMKNRIDNFLRDSEVKKQHKQLKKVVTIIMILSFTALSSLTVCAYDCPQEQGFVWDENIRCIEREEDYYGKTEVEISEASDFSTYDTLCVDKDGNISVVQENITKGSKCSHNYKNIKMIEKHSKLKNGGCEVKMYKGKKCSKCGKVLSEREGYAVLEHRECPHKK